MIMLAVIGDDDCMNGEKKRIKRKDKKDIRFANMRRISFLKKWSGWPDSN